MISILNTRMEFHLRNLILLLTVHFANTKDSRNNDLCKEGGAIPSMCKGRHVEEMVIIYCRSANLTALPKTLPKATSVLHLQGNNIEVLPSYSFSGCSYMEYLDLSNNLLHSVRPNAFESLHSLKKLYLDHNNLDFTSDLHASTDIFHPVQSLEILYIHHNKWKDAIEYRDDIFTSLNELKILAMDGVPNPYAVLGSGFQNLRKLEELYIQAGLTYVANETFISLSTSPLEKLVIHTGVLMDLDAMAFSHFKDLKELDLSYNPLLGLKNASKAWYGLQFTNIQILKLQHSVLFERQVILVEESFYDHLDKTSIKELYIDGNNIITVYANLNEYLPHLVKLSISYNRLSQVNNIMKDIASLQQLKYLNANYQTRRKRITELALILGHGRPDLPKGNATEDSGYMQTITAQNVTKYANNVNIPSILNTKLCYSIGNYAYDGQPEPLPDPEDLLYIKLPPNIEELHLSESLSVDWYTSPRIIMEGPSNLQFLDYSGNGLVILKGPVIFVNNTGLNLTLDVSKNQATFIDPEFLQLRNSTGGKIVAIDASENKLGPQLKEERMGVFNSYLELKELNLSENQIYELPSDIFQVLKKLEHLSLSKNSLREMTISPDTLQHLLHLDLSSNLLSSLKQSTCDALDIQGLNITVVLSDNPFVCSCDTLDFLKWVRQTEVNLIDYQKYECSYRGTLFQFHDLDKIINKLNIECSMTTIILGVTIPVVVMVIIIALSFFCHRHKWEIRFWFMHNIIRKKPPVQNRNFAHDAFVSFQERDLPFVKNELIPNLEQYASKEGEHNFKLVVHHRDFAIGYPIADNIYEAIENSKKTLVVLSNNYVESNWTYFELQMATMRTLDDGRDIIIVIVLESVPARKMTSALLQLLQHNTYIEWPSHEVDKPLFWQRLREALKKDIPRPVRCQTCAKIVYQKKPKVSHGDTTREDPLSREVTTWNPVFVDDENVCC